MNKKIIPVIVFILVVAGVLVWFVRNRAINDRNRIPVSGNVEVTEIQVSFMTAGRVLERCVDEGQVVKAGDLVARLDRVELEQVLEQAKAALAESKEALAEAEAKLANLGRRPASRGPAEARPVAKANAAAPRKRVAPRRKVTPASSAFSPAPELAAPDQAVPSPAQSASTAAPVVAARDGEAQPDSSPATASTHPKAP